MIGIQLFALGVIAYAAVNILILMAFLKFIRHLVAVIERIETRIARLENVDIIRGRLDSGEG